MHMYAEAPLKHVLQILVQMYCTGIAEGFLIAGIKEPYTHWRVLRVRYPRSESGVAWLQGVLKICEDYHRQKKVYKSKRNWPGAEAAAIEKGMRAGPGLRQRREEEWNRVITDESVCELLLDDGDVGNLRTHAWRGLWERGQRNTWQELSMATAVQLPQITKDMIRCLLPSPSVRGEGTGDSALRRGERWFDGTENDDRRLCDARFCFNATLGQLLVSGKVEASMSRTKYRPTVLFVNFFAAPVVAGGVAGDRPVVAASVKAGCTCANSSSGLCAHGAVVMLQIAYWQKNFSRKEQQHGPAVISRDYESLKRRAEAGDSEEEEGDDFEQEERLDVDVEDHDNYDNGGAE